jgi:hypothetical protein
MLGVSLLWSVPWALAATSMALLLHVRAGYQQRRLEAYLTLIDWPAWAGGSVGYLAVHGGMVGFINGLLLAGAIMVAYRGRTTIDRLASWQFAALGGLATALVATVWLRMPSSMASVCAAAGAASGVAYLTLAKHRARADHVRERREQRSALPNEAPLQPRRVEDVDARASRAHRIL